MNEIAFKSRFKQIEPVVAAPVIVKEVSAFNINGSIINQESILESEAQDPLAASHGQKAELGSV